MPVLVTTLIPEGRKVGPVLCVCSNMSLDKPKIDSDCGELELCSWLYLALSLLLCRLDFFLRLFAMKMSSSNTLRTTPAHFWAGT